MLKGIAALHRLDIVHRDLKSANLHLDAEGKLRILDKEHPQRAILAPEMYSALGQECAVEDQ